MLSGEGAYLYGGRWNSKRTRMVYLGSSLAQASIELLVHLGRHDVLKDFNTLKVNFEDTLITHIDENDLPDDWITPSMATSVQATGDAWVRSNDSLLLQVPSVAVRGEYNFLLNPTHPDMSKLNIESIKPFKFDARVKK